MTTEQWRVDAGDADVAILDIPPALGRMRRFQLDVRFVVACAAPAADAWHALTVEVNGRRQWSRRIATHAPSDSLDYSCRLDVGEGAALRVRATTRVARSVQRQGLRIDAEEQA
jgi:hypothetical protein